MSKRIRTLLMTLLLVVSLALAFGAGCALGNAAPPVSGKSLDVVQEAWDIIFRDYVDKNRLDASLLSEGAIKGMVKALDDPYTSYLSAKAYKMSMSDLSGKFEGIGAYVGVKDEKIMVISPIPDSPAARAGIQAGDIILEINGNSTAEMSLEEAVLNIRGPKGTTVRLLILHQGKIEPEEIDIVRAEIEVKSVSFEMKGDIAYIYIHYFSERTNEELSPVLESLSREGATGIVLDLRRNPGGLLDEVVDVTSRFLEEGIVVSVVNNRGDQSSLSVNTRQAATALPLVVLTDNYTASASEVLAGALQDYARATIAGTKTYGKGSVNSLRHLKDGSGLFITTGRWLTPKGRLIEGEGISPDYTLELEGEEAIQWAIDYLKGNK